MKILARRKQELYDREQANLDDMVGNRNRNEMSSTVNLRMK
jgi:hypothetical protein